MFPIKVPLNGRDSPLNLIIKTLNLIDEVHSEVFDKKQKKRACHLGMGQQIDVTMEELSEQAKIISFYFISITLIIL